MKNKYNEPIDGKNLFGETIEEMTMERRKNSRERKKTEELRINENATVKVTKFKDAGSLGERTIVTLGLEFDDSKNCFETDFCFGLTFFSVSRQKIKKLLFDAVLRASEHCPKTANDPEQLMEFRSKILDQFDVDMNGDIIYVRNPKELKHATHRFEEGYWYFDIGTGFGVKVLKRNKHSVVFTYYEISEDGTILQGNPEDAHEIGICGDSEILSDGTIESGLFYVRAEQSLVTDKIVGLNVEDVSIEI